MFNGPVGGAAFYGGVQTIGSMTTGEGVGQNWWINSAGSPVWCENDRASLFDDTQDAVPQEAPGFGVHPSGWLILQSR